ncbi:hypothetical protein ISS30_00810 [bacterium]|nr:hypothetical protein [bacterium]
MHSDAGAWEREEILLCCRPSAVDSMSMKYKRMVSTAESRHHTIPFWQVLHAIGGCDLPVLAP